MLQNLFKFRHKESEDDGVLEGANQALHDRMEEMLARDSVRKMRFATLQSAPAHLR